MNKIPGAIGALAVVFDEIRQERGEVIPPGEKQLSVSNINRNGTKMVVISERVQMKVKSNQFHIIDEAIVLYNKNG